MFVALIHLHCKGLLTLEELKKVLEMVYSEHVVHYKGLMLKMFER